MGLQLNEDGINRPTEGTINFSDATFQMPSGLNIPTEEWLDAKVQFIKAWDFLIVGSGTQMAVVEF